MAQPEPMTGARAPSGRFGRLVAALAAGVVGGLIAPLIYPSVARTARPTAKRMLKAGFTAFEQGRVAAAELAEHASDLLAEARVEYEEEHKLHPRNEQAGAANEIVKLRGAGREASSG